MSRLDQGVSVVDRQSPTRGEAHGDFPETFWARSGRDVWSLDLGWLGNQIASFAKTVGGGKTTRITRTRGWAFSSRTVGWVRKKVEFRRLHTTEGSYGKTATVSHLCVVYVGVWMVKMILMVIVHLDRLTLGTLLLHLQPLS